MNSNENNFDINTGQPINNGGNNMNNNKQSNKKGLAIASMILGILAILGSWIPYLNIGSIIMALVGIGLGIPALVIYIKTKKSSLGMALTGLILSVLTIIIAVAMNIAVTDAIVDELDTYDYDYDYYDNY